MSESQIYQVRIKQASANLMSESQENKASELTRKCRVTNIPSGENKASESDNKMSESQIYQVVRIKQASMTRKCQSHKYTKCD